MLIAEPAKCSPSPLNEERAGVRGEAVRLESRFNRPLEISKNSFPWPIRLPIDPASLRSDRPRILQIHVCVLC